MNDKRLLLVYAIVLVDLAAGSIVLPIMPELVKATQYPELWLSLGAGLFLGFQLFTATLLGKLSDLKGRKPVFILSAIGTTFANLLLLPINTWGYIANRSADGLTNGVYATVRASIADISTPDTLARNMGIEGSIAALGFVTGPFLSGALLMWLDVDGAEAVWPLIWLGIIVSCLNIFFAFIFKETHPTPPNPSAAQTWSLLKKQLNFKTTIRELLELREQQPSLYNLLLYQFFMMMALGYYHYFLIYISLGELQMTPKEISIFFIYFGSISIVVGYVFYTRLVHRIQPRRWLKGLALIGIFLHIAYAFTGDSYVWIYVFLTIDVLTIGLFPGIVDGLVGKETQEDNRGKIFGISQLLMGIANIITVLVFTGLSVIALELPFFWFALCMVPLLWIKVGEGTTVGG